MKENAYLEFALHPSFLENPSHSVSEYEPDFLKMLRESFIEAFNCLEMAKAKIDIRKSKVLNSITTDKVEFTQEDENEIKRSDSYKICTGMGQSPLTIANFKKGLLKQGIQDIDLQNYILQLILQTRIGIHFLAVGRGLIYVAIATGGNSAYITVSTDTADFSLSYDRYFESVELSFKGSITYSSNPAYIIGKAEMVLTISKSLTTKIKRLQGIIKPLSVIRKDMTDGKIVSSLKATLNEMYKNLHAYSLMSPNSTSSNARIESHPPLDLRSQNKEPVSYPSQISKWLSPLIADFTNRLKVLYPVSTRVMPQEAVPLIQYQSYTSSIHPIFNGGRDKEPTEMLKYTCNKENYSIAFTIYPSGLIQETYQPVASTAMEMFEKPKEFLVNK